MSSIPGLVLASTSHDASILPTSSTTTFRFGYANFWSWQNHIWTATPCCNYVPISMHVLFSEHYLPGHIWDHGDMLNVPLQRKDHYPGRNHSSWPELRRYSTGWSFNKCRPILETSLCRSNPITWRSTNCSKDEIGLDYCWAAGTSAYEI